MEQKKMARTKAKDNWIKENTTQISLQLTNKGDSDILAAIEGKAKQTEIKRLLRIALEFERKEKEEEADLVTTTRPASGSSTTRPGLTTSFSPRSSSRQKNSE